jgi:ADP-ribosyl-[dinitrogen reductase] hydrolase
MLLELAIADAYGAGFEYAPDSVVRRHNDLSRYIPHDRHGLKPGRYTDDTQMSLAIAEALVSGLKWSREFLADKFVECFKRDPRKGYAGGFYDFLTSVSDGADFLRNIRPDSDKSGAAMRACPIGIFPDPREVTRRCTLQAALTHDTPAGIAAACAASLLTHYCLYDLGPLADAGQFIEQHAAGPWSQPWTRKVGPKGYMSVAAAITAVSRNSSLSTLLKDCISFTGDVDTVASIALASASSSPRYTQDLPTHLIDSLESGPFGRDYLVSLDRKLSDLHRQLTNQ